VKYSVTANGSVASSTLYSGVNDWGRVYASVSFPVSATCTSPARQVSVGWTYDDDENFILAKQQGYQGALTLFRDLFVKTTWNVDPRTNSRVYAASSWGVRKETDGSITVETLGQKVVHETNAAYKAASILSKPPDMSLSSAGYFPFSVQPTGPFYVITGQFDFALDSTTQAGFRVLASDFEYTDILYDPVAENFTVVRNQSSLIKSYGDDTELGKLKLWNTIGSKVKTMNLTVYVDNSVIECYVNDEFALTTRVYPWLSKSTGAGLLVGTAGSPVHVSHLEMWDGLVKAWPDRPDNSSRGLVWDGPAASLYGLWAGI